MTKALITGGCGFIGSAMVRHVVSDLGWTVLNVDKLTYAGNPEAVAAVSQDARYHFLKADICDREAIARAIAVFKPDVIVHFAAESHVDRSIAAAEDFIQTNIIGTYRLLECALDYYRGLDVAAQAAFRFHHVSTDEVYGELGEEGAFTEETAYDPSSPYSASKAASDHLVRAWARTFKLPVTISNCSNNYGSYQNTEKLIPRIITNAYLGKELPVYGQGNNVRDWLFVDDHVKAIVRILADGKTGETYNIGGRAERRNIDVVRTICRILDRKLGGVPRESLIRFVTDRPGHDFRYAIDCSKIEQELGWSPAENFESGLEKTIDWYLANLDEQYQSGMKAAV